MWGSACRQACPAPTEIPWAGCRTGPTACHMLNHCVYWGEKHTSRSTWPAKEFCVVNLSTNVCWQRPQGESSMSCNRKVHVVPSRNRHFEFGTRPQNIQYSKGVSSPQKEALNTDLEMPIQSMEAGRGGNRTSYPQNRTTSSSLAWSLRAYSSQGHWVIKILCPWHTWEKIIQPPADVVWILTAEPDLPWTAGAVLLGSSCICHLFKPQQVPLLYTQCLSVGFHRLDWLGFSQGFPTVLPKTSFRGQLLKAISCLNTLTNKIPQKLKFQFTCPDVPKQA